MSDFVSQSRVGVVLRSLSLPLKIALSFAGVAGLLLSAFIAVGIIDARQQDRLSVISARNFVGNAFAQDYEQLRGWALGSSVWDEAYTQIVANHNYDWARAKLGPTNWAIYKTPVTGYYIVDATGRTVLRQSVESLPARFDTFYGAGWRDVIAQVRPGGGARLQIVLSHGQAFVMSASPIEPSDPSDVAKAVHGWTMMWVQKIDAHFLDKIDGMDLLSMADWHAGDPPPGEEAVYRLRDPRGYFAGYVRWQQAYPGQAMLRDAAVPTALLILLCCAAGGWQYRQALSADRELQRREIDVEAAQQAAQQLLDQVRQQAAEAERIAQERHHDRHLAIVTAERRSETLRHGFDADVRSVIGAITTIAAKLAAKSDELEANATNGLSAMATVEATTRATSDAIGQVDRGSGQLDELAIELDENTAEMRTVMEKAYAVSLTALRQVDDLAHHSTSIERVIDTVTALAKKVGLLALNAQIEAARAGDAGRGFAVVAQEVKSLSRNASEEVATIAEVLRRMRGAAQSTITSIQGIADAIDGAEQRSRASVTAVGAQRAKAGEMRSIAAEAIYRTSETGDAFAFLAGSVEHSNETARELRALARELDERFQELSGAAEGFNTVLAA